MMYSNSGILFRRHVWLVETVSGQPLTREGISGKWERSSLNDDGGPLPKKTFHNHIDAIEEIFGLCIRCRKEGNRTYYIENRDDVENAGGLCRWLINTISMTANGLAYNVITPVKERTHPRDGSYSTNSGRSRLKKMGHIP